MKKWSTLTCLFALLLLFALVAFRTIAPNAATSTARASMPVYCAPITINSITNALPFSLAKYVNENVRTRRNIYSWSESDFEDYKRAIIAMRALPYNDPTSLEYQSAIHGTALTDNLQSWNNCQHGTRFFYSWHRMYIYFFERIVRAKSGNSNFTMPYWDYQTNPVMPPQFRENTPGNPLYDATRFASINDGAALPSSISTSINTALNNILFDDFQTRMENPHGAVHNAIGGNMRLIRSSGKDPIFYLHHTNIDRLWEVWLWRCGGRATPTASDATWWNQRFTFFDENGQAVVMTGSQIVDIANQLNYRYDTPAPFTTTITTDSTTTPDTTTTPTPTTTAVRIEAEDYTTMRGIRVISTTDEGGGRCIDGISNGDYMDYTVNVPAAGTYTMNFRVAMGTSTAGQFQVRTVSGTRLATVNIPNTGGATTYTTINATVTLPAGSQTLRIYTVQGGWLINWLEIIVPNSTNPDPDPDDPDNPTDTTTTPPTDTTTRPPTDTTTTPPTDTTTTPPTDTTTTPPTDTTTTPPPPATLRIEAENYTAMRGVATATTTDEGGGLMVRGISNGDYMDYTVNVPAAGTYTMNFRVAMGGTTTGQLQVRNMAATRLAVINIPNTGGATVFTTLSAAVTLPAGQQTLRFYAAYGGWDFNWFEIVNPNSINARMNTNAKTTITTTITTPCGSTTTTTRMMNYASIKWGAYELLTYQNITRLNQTQTQLPLTNANAEGIQAYLSKTNNRQFKISQNIDGDKLLADIELLKVNKLPEGVVEVYLNLPAGTTPLPNSIYFADVLNLFGTSDHIHHNEKGANIITVDLTAAAAAQGLTPANLSKAKLTFVVRGNRLPNGQEVKTSFDAQMGTIKFRLRKLEK